MQRNSKNETDQKMIADGLALCAQIEEETYHNTEQAERLRAFAQEVRFNPEQTVTPYVTPQDEIAVLYGKIESEPNNGKFYYERAVLQLYFNNLQEAIDDYEKARELGFADISPTLFVGTYVKLKQYGKAIAIYDAALQKYPNDAYLYYHRAYAKLQMGIVHAGAILEDLEKAKQLDSTIKPDKAFAKAYALCGGYDYIQKAIALDENCVAIYESKAVLSYQHALKSNGEEYLSCLYEALDDCLKAITLGVKLEESAIYKTLLSKKQDILNYIKTLTEESQLKLISECKQLDASQRTPFAQYFWTSHGVNDCSLSSGTLKKMMEHEAILLKKAQKLKLWDNDPTAAQTANHMMLFNSYQEFKKPFEHTKSEPRPFDRFEML